MAKRKPPPPRPMPPGRTAQQPMAQTGADLMRAIQNFIPIATPLSPERSSDVTPKRKGRGK
jgi:hypothetical protein